MATVANNPAQCSSKTEKVQPPEEHIPDIIEERRKDSEGRIISNRYLRGKLLGKGGFAKCYLGTSMQSKNQYALKIVSKGSLIKPRAKQKLQTEIKIHRTLNHAHVVRFERFFEDNHNAYMLLELCANNSMSDLMKRRKKLCDFEARFYLTQIISSLKYLHDHGVIHRDLKLGNLFIDHHMCVKIGDFGLATRLTHPDERKKTVCGTPNYIAPEILEGKDGHSFEVDIWSTGVILYTFLIGKPPFESKDVKSTYKRIVANQYSFPDHTPICEHAMGLIRHMLQPRPEKRPSLDAAMEHAFFSRAGAYTPTSLPESSLRDAPASPTAAELQQCSERVANANTWGVNEYANPRKVLGGVYSHVNDENDPAVVNMNVVPPAPPALERAQSQPITKVASAASDYTDKEFTRGSSSSNGSSGGGLGVRPMSALAERHTAHAQPVLAQRSKSTPVPENSSANVAPSVSGGRYSAVSSSSRGIYDAQSHASSAVSTNGSGGSTTYGGRSALTASAGMSGDRAVSSTASFGGNNLLNAPVPRVSVTGKPFQSLGQGEEKGGYSQRFDIYQDSKQQQSLLSGKSANLPLPAPLSRTASYGMTSQEGSSTRGTSPRTVYGTNDDFGFGEDVGADEGPMDVERIGADLDGVHLTHKRTSSMQQHVPQSAWESNTNVAAAAAAAPSTQFAHSMAASAPAPAAASVREPEGHHTPAHAMHREAPKPLDTLETMHKMLNRSFNDNPLNKSDSHGDEDIDADALAAASTPDECNGVRWSQNSRANKDVHKLIARVWVVRYVDYTSKYGLGFLLNTGSAGVYFNDSTKIVLSADGSIFQYIERRRKEGQANSEHVVQTHYMTAYPVELQKKVTLLRHFRNYLVDQQKMYGQGSRTGESTLESVSSLPMSLPDSSSSGADPRIPFGTSSAQFDPTDAVEMGLSSPTNIQQLQMQSRDSDMPFLKKWVRTRHAILFRLSNRIVQVVFFDRSEVLLSSEARVVTYVNKQGDREDHSLEDVLHAGRTDIAKRLKYTKDIMYRLINVAK